MKLYKFISVFLYKFILVFFGVVLIVPISGWSENGGTYPDIHGADELINDCDRVINEDIGFCKNSHESVRAASHKILLRAQAIKNSAGSVDTQTGVSERAVDQAKDLHIEARVNCSVRLKIGDSDLSEMVSLSEIKKCMDVCSDHGMRELIEKAKTGKSLDDQNKVTAVGENALAHLENRRNVCNREGQSILSQLDSNIKFQGSLAQHIANTGKAFAAQSSASPWINPDNNIDPEKKGLFTTDNLKKVGIGAAAGAGAMYFLNSSKDKKEKDKKEKEEQANATQQATADQKEKDFQNGYAYNASGVRVNCQSAAEFSTPECKSVLLNFCGKDENSNNASCNAFASNYCSGADASQSFCLNQSVRLYCAQTGPYISANPSCQWISARPTNCSRQPESSACLLNWTAAKISEECPKYPYDPLCKAHKEGKKVLQLESAAAAVADLNATGGGLNSIINSTDQASASSSVNLFGAGSAAIADLCATGQLTNCN